MSIEGILVGSLAIVIRAAALTYQMRDVGQSIATVDRSAYPW